MGGRPTEWCLLLKGLAAAAATFAAPSSLLRAQPDPPPPSTDLKQLSLEQLLDIEITSVSRIEENLRAAAAAVTVVTNEDIRRTGARSLPEALRLVPGIHVGRRNSNSWTVSARGFSSITSEKLLVLSDTRSIYTPLVSGVFWDAQDYLLEDVERIEVIRGPGAALWGSNAVNGVINITTKSARDTQGLYLEAGAGTEERATAAARFGGSNGEDAYYRVYAQYFERDATFNTDPVHSDDWRVAHAGFRSDWVGGDGDTFTLQGDAYSGNVGQLAPAVTIIGRPGPAGDLEVDIGGGNLLGRWRRTSVAGSELEFRAYYDRTHRDDPSFEDALDTVDLDFQHALALSSRQELTWGANYRYTSNRNEGKGIFAVEPSTSDDQLLSAFVQDQIAVSSAWRVTLGTKLEHNDFSGFELQPSVRAVWDLRRAHTLWSSISRAVRVPTRLERDVAIDATDPAGNPVARLLGNEDFESEELLAYELGYRWQPAESLFIDLAGFYNDYEELASLEFGEPFVDPQDGRTIIPVVNLNLTRGNSQGVEALIAYSPLENWRLSAVYSYVDLSLDPTGMDLNRGEFLEGSTPRHQLGLRSYLDLPGGFQLDAQFRSLSAVKSIPGIASGEGIGGYSELDVRVAWQGGDGWEISVIGQNLLHDHHAEFGTPESRGEIERGVLGRVVCRF